jgi:DNA polymerase III subunit gamma/tau
MGYLVLARKWRPQQFDDVVGQEHVTKTLQNAIAQQRIAHAFLFSGPRGVGKTTVARLLAKALNCAQGPTGTPCGTCASCIEVAAGNALDVIEIDGASNTGVDNVRDLNENIRYRPAAARFKIYIIDEVHMLSTAAFNALLKTLEEPPEHIKFIFATTEVQKLPQTVVSRCQRYEFKRIPMAQMIERLHRIAADEKLKVSDAALFALAREADGSMRDAQSLLDQVIVFAGKKIDEEDVRAALGVADRTLLHQVTEAILTRDPRRCLKAVDELHRYGYEVQQFCRDLVRQLRNLTVAALFQDRSLLADLPDNEIEETLRQAVLRPPVDLQRLFRLAQEGAEETRRSQLPALVLEMAVVKMASMPDATPVGELITRLEELERRLRGAGGEAPGGRGGTTPGRPAAGTGRAGSAPARTAPEDRDLASEAAARPAGAREAATAPAPPGGRRAAPPPAMAREPLALDKPHVNGQSEGWTALLAAVRERVGLKMYLNGSRPLEETTELIHIGVEHELAQRGLLDPENLRTLREIVTRCYGGARQIRVSVVQESADEIAARAALVESRRRELTERAQTNPAVRAAVEILGGEVMNVRPRSRGGQDGG